MKRVITLLVLVSISTSTLANGFKTQNEAKKFSDRLVEFFVKENFQAGFDTAKPYWPIPAVEVDGSVNQINQQWPLIQNRFGKSLSIEFLKSERLGESFTKHYYLHKFENHAIYWSISFYKPKDLWVINHLIFLDTLDHLYE